MQTFGGRRNFGRQFLVLSEAANEFEQDRNVTRCGLSDLNFRVVALRHAPIVADECVRGQRTRSRRTKAGFAAVKKLYLRRKLGRLLPPTVFFGSVDSAGL